MLIKKFNKVFLVMLLGLTIIKNPIQVSAQDISNESEVSIKKESESESKSKTNKRDLVTRADFVDEIIKIMEMDRHKEKVNGVYTGFSDVNTSEWYSSGISIARANKLISGYCDGTFKPDEKITYGEVITIISKLMPVGEEGDVIEEANTVEGIDITEENADIAKDGDTAEESGIPEGKDATKSEEVDTTKEGDIVKQGELFLLEDYSDELLKFKFFKNMVKNKLDEPVSKYDINLLKKIDFKSIAKEEIDIREYEKYVEKMQNKFNKIEKKRLIEKEAKEKRKIEKQKESKETVNQRASKAIGNKQVVKTMTMQATAYSDNVESQGKWLGQTATGMKPQVGVIAVDPRVIPLHTKLYVEGYGHAIAGDTGGAIKGNRIDLFYNTRQECRNFGRRNVVVHVLAD